MAATPDGKHLAVLLTTEEVVRLNTRRFGKWVRSETMSFPTILDLMTQVAPRGVCLWATSLGEGGCIASRYAIQ